MTTVEDSFRNTLEEFKKSLTKKERDSFKSTTLEEVHNVILEIQKQQETTKNMMNFTRLKSFLEAMGQFGEVIEVFLNTTEFVAFVWGPMKFILQVCSEPVIPR